MCVNFLTLPRVFIICMGILWTTVAWSANDARAHESMYQAPGHQSELYILEQKLKDDNDQKIHNQEYLNTLRAQVDATVSPAVTSLQVEQANFNVGTVNMQVEKLMLELAATRKDIRMIDSYIDQYEKQLIAFRARGADNVVGIVQERLLSEKAKLKVQKERVDTLSESLVIAEETLALSQALLAELNQQMRVEEVSSIWEEQQTLEQHLLGEQQNWESKLSVTRDALDKTRPIQNPPTDQQQKLQDDMLEAEENVEILKAELTVSRIDALLTVYEKRHESTATVRQSIELGDRLDTLKDELVGLHILVENNQILLQRQMGMLTQPAAVHVLSSVERDRQSTIIKGLLDHYQNLDTHINDLMSRISQFQNVVMEGTNQSWQTRQKLPHTLKGWQLFVTELWVLPQVAYQSLVAAYHQCVENLSEARWGTWLGLILSVSVWAGIWIWVERALGKFLYTLQDLGKSFSANTFVIVAQLVYRNILGIVIFGVIILTMGILGLSSNLMIVPIALGCVWFIYKAAIGIARISLFENIWDVSGQDVSLYHGLKYSLGFSGFIIALTVLAHQLPIPLDIVASYDRLFMLVLLGIAIPFLRQWRVLPSLIAQEGHARPYVRRAIFWLGFLIPLTILSNAVIGLIGFVNLAWSMWIIEAQCLFVLTIWVIARGVINDLMESLAKYTIRHLSSGWVWTESILKPINTILHIGIMMAAVYFLFMILHLNQNPAITSKLQLFTSATLFMIGASSITAYNCVQFVILLIVIRWAAKWSREFAYRFIFAKYRDKGIRNSLSVFTQYGTVIVGSFVVLRVVGIDLTTLTVILGALAVGIGFGLQGIANNLISGILLLIERPFRAGDIIQVGTHEGEVTHIGVRATTLKTWDNMEVIIPNAEAVSHPLTNWTHHDAIVRTTLNMGVGFNENPHQVQALIMQVLHHHPAVTQEISPSALLQEFGEYSQIFQVRYYIDLSLGKSRTQVKSEVLFALWDALRNAGVELPYPHQEVLLSNT